MFCERGLNSMQKHISIAIDGPSGSGKSTLAKLLSKEFGYVYVDTGALYRTIGYFVMRRGVSCEDTAGVIDCLKDINITMEMRGLQSAVLLDGVAVGDEIRTPECSVYASNVSKRPEVRAFLLDLQRNIAKTNDVIMDGRDIGTVILPDATVKIFLCASDKTRAIRRFEELKAKGVETTLEEVEKDMKWRDANDKERKIAPAVPAPDSVILDNSLLTLEGTVEAAVKIIKDGIAAK